ncbi:MAG: DUF3572 domain-containing protein [Pseudomonadota bacterium]
MRTEAAEALAAAALTWMASDAPLVERFLANSGAAPGDLAAMSRDPSFLGFVLDFLLGDEDTLLAFAQTEKIDPATVMRARQALPGGATPEWT